MNFVYISFGSNLNNPIAQCLKALEKIRQFPKTNIIEISPFYRTEPVGPIKQNWFTNGVFKVSTNLDPFHFLHLCQQVELKQQRKNKQFWGPRTIDLDLILWENLIINSIKLKVPHPYMHRRRFVLQPLEDIEPGLIHPLIGKSTKYLLNNLNDSSKIFRIGKCKDDSQGE